MVSSDALILAFLVLPIAVFVIIGIWRATSPQKGTGCPCCDKHLGDHDNAHGEQCTTADPPPVGKTD